MERGIIRKRETKKNRRRTISEGRRIEIDEI